MAGIKRPPKRPIKANLWKCDDLKALIKEQINVHVKDVDLARRLEKALSGEIAYGDGGGGNVGVA
jgi:hypothetical protein